jgi:hypothetical protein
VDRSFWKSIIEADFAVPAGYALEELTAELTGYLCLPDAELRDEFAYFILAHWILAGHYAPEVLRAMAERQMAALDVGLGENGTDSVYGRSFATLILAAITYYDNHQPFLTADEVHRMLDRALDYFARERDLRGFVPGQGWAHSAAHTADWIDELALSRQLGADDLGRILAALADKVRQSDLIFLCSEDERLSVAASSALRRMLLPREAVIAWLATLSGVLDQYPRAVRMIDPQAHAATLNTKNLVRSLYLRLALTADLPDGLRHLLPEVLMAAKAFVNPPVSD